MSRLRANFIVNRDANGPIEATEGLKLTASKHTIYQSGSSIVDTNLNEFVKFSETAAAVNEITIANATVSGTPTISATGDDANVSLNIVPKGTGTVNVGGVRVVTSTFSAVVNFAQTTANLTLGGAQTTGVWTAGGTAQTGTLTLGQSTSTQITNIQAGATASGNTKTINLGTGGIAGSSTSINIGPSTGGTVVITSGTKLGIGVTPSTYDLQVSGTVGGNSFNRVTVTAPATGSTLTIADGKTLTVNNSLTFSGTDSSTLNFGTGGTILYTTHEEQLYELDDISGVDDIENTFSLFSNFQSVTITDPYKLLVTIDGVLQPTYVYNREYVFLSNYLDSSKYGYTIDHDNKIKFTKSVTWSNKIVMRTIHGVTKATAKSYPFTATDIMFF